MPIGDERKAQSLPTSNASRAGRVLTNAQIAVPPLRTLRSALELLKKKKISHQSPQQ
jgi:hypothetical protein